VLVEGNFDVLSLHARGVANVVGILGTAFTPEQAKLLKRYAPSVVFMLDGDRAGREAVRKSRAAIREAMLSARVATLSGGVDPDQLAREKGKQGIDNLVATAKGMLEALIEMSLDDTFIAADAHERQSRIQYVSKLITEEDDPVVRAMLKGFTDSIAGRLDIARAGNEAFRALEDQVKRDVARAGPKAPPSRPAYTDKEARIQPLPPGSKLKGAIVGALIEYPMLLDDEEVAEALEALEGPSVMVVAALRRAWDGEAKTLDTDAFLSQIPATHKGFAAKHLAAPEGESESAAKGYLLENAKQLKRLLLSQEAAQITRETYRAQGDWEAEQELAKAVDERVRKKKGL
jgi:DNA primase